VGARRNEVLQQFLMESAILSGAGGALGTLIAGIVDITGQRLPFGGQPPPTR
jgi:ABC-type antimicrobial peptide transport system permease subunit